MAAERGVVFKVETDFEVEAGFDFDFGAGFTLGVDRTVRVGFGVGNDPMESGGLIAGFGVDFGFGFGFGFGVDLGRDENVGCGSGLAGKVLFGSKVGVDRFGGDDFRDGEVFFLED